MSHQLAKEDEQKLNKGTDPARNKLHAGRGGEHPCRKRAGSGG